MLGECRLNGSRIAAVDEEEEVYEMVSTGIIRYYSLYMSAVRSEWGDAPAKRSVEVIS